MKFIVRYARKTLHGFPLLKKIIKFGIVGSSAAVISLSIHWLIILQFPQMNLVGKAIGAIVGFFVGFALNKIWTYVDRTSDDEKYLLRYSIVYIVTFFIYLSINYFLDHVVKMKAVWRFQPEVISNIICTGINAVLNFIGTNYLVFRIRREDSTEEEI